MRMKIIAIYRPAENRDTHFEFLIVQLHADDQSNNFFEANPKFFRKLSLILFFSLVLSLRVLNLA